VKEGNSMQGFFLGLSSGTACLAYCAPTLFPYLLGEGKNIRNTAALTIKFLLGRLVGYMAFAVIAWLTGLSLQNYPAFSELCQSLAYISLAVMLLFYGSKFSTPTCIAAKVPQTIWHKYPAILPGLMGLMTGLNLCPPFLLLFAEATVSHSFAETLWYFFTFFLGTALYFLPLPLIGAAKLNELRLIGKLAAVLMSLYYFYSGVMILLKGVSLL
jgi:sulfite exporter TauE/SafE